MRNVMVLVFILLVFIFAPFVDASGHREAPITALDQKADITDVFAFRSYDGGATPRVTMISVCRSISRTGQRPELVPF